MTPEESFRKAFHEFAHVMVFSMDEAHNMIKRFLRSFNLRGNCSCGAPLPKRGRCRKCVARP